MNDAQTCCIDLDQPALEGFRKFISSWVYQCESFTLLIDPGPLSSIPRLCSELQKFGIRRLDYVLLTHIHIDHAGGTGALLKQYPDAAVICHPDGIRHMISPDKLWEGSRKVLGELAGIYGEIVAVPPERIRFEELIGTTGIRSFLTPGHAQHHCSYLLGDLLFGGEVAGVRYDLPDAVYMRPATPPRFILQVALDSILRMIKLAPQRMVFAHYGMVDNAVMHLELARNQLLTWVGWAAASADIAATDREQWLVNRLLEHDELYSSISLLPVDIQARERYFLGNTLRGMFEYVDGLEATERMALAASPSGMRQV